MKKDTTSLLKIILTIITLCIGLGYFVDGKMDRMINSVNGLAVNVGKLETQVKNNTEQIEKNTNIFLEIKNNPSALNSAITNLKEYALSKSK